MHPIAEAWKAQGFEVEVVQGPDEPARADIAVLHTDITTVPVEYLAAIRKYPKTLNGHVADISKRFVSDNLVTRLDSWVGPVIAIRFCRVDPTLCGEVRRRETPHTKAG